MGVRVAVVLVVLASLVAGCVTLNLPRERVELTPPAGCPALDVSDLNAVGNFDCNTPAAELQCALAGLRAAKPDIRVAQAATRVCFLLADMEQQPQRQERFAAEGVRWAESALDEGPPCGADSYYYALNLGLAVRRHASLALKSLKHLQQALEKANQLSPDIDQGGPLRLLGMLYLLAPDWPDGIGDGEKALELLRQVVEQHPGHPLNQIFIARALAQEEEDQEAAGQHLLQAARLLQLPAWRGACARWKKELEKVAEGAEIDPPDFSCPQNPAG